jgi:hypothetical protein
MLHPRFVLGLALLGGSIVVPGHAAVNGGSLGEPGSWRQWSDGSPMPIPKPAGELFRADGSPMPIPKPTGTAAQAA